MESCISFQLYIFQIMAQLLEFRSSVTDTYRALFPAFLAPALWENHGNCPALVRVIEAYLEKGGAGFFVEGKYIEPLLGKPLAPLPLPPFFVFNALIHLLLF